MSHHLSFCIDAHICYSLTIGGGPGTSGLINPLGGQSHCKVTENGTVANPYRWTQKYNLLALDHVSTGLSRYE